MTKNPSSQTRRSVLAVSAAAGITSLFPMHLAAEGAAHPTRPSSQRDADMGTTNADAIRPFTFHAPQAKLDDLRRRIVATQWPERETVADQSQGVQLATMRELAHYWARDYDWRKVEARLSALPQFITVIDGLDIHFIHVRSKHENALPIVINHGWPGSIIEQLKIIEPLVNPTAHGGSASDAFHVVIPSMPGYGFSEKPTSTGWGPERMGLAWAELMKRLGYARYVAQGGDWGAFVVDYMGVQAPAGLLGIHTNYPGAVPADVYRELLAGGPAPSGLSTQERRAYEQLDATFKQKVAYAKYMSARPQTLYGIADSPVGLAAWLLDHDDGGGQPAAAVVAALNRTTSATGELTRDNILDNITLFWLTNTGVSASRLYWEYKGGFWDAKASPHQRPSASSLARHIRRRGAGQSGRIPSSSTSMRSQRAGTLRPGSSRSSSQRRFAPASDHFAHSQERSEATSAVVVTNDVMELISSFWGVSLWPLQSWLIEGNLYIGVDVEPT